MNGSARLERVIYIASVAYSGSTLLDMLMGSHAQVTSLGEVQLLARYARNGSPCTCGAAVSACPFWNQVDAALRGRLGDRFPGLGDFPLDVETKGRGTFRWLPSVTDLSLVIGSRGLWDRVAAWHRRSGLSKQAAENKLALFETIAELRDTPFVVDSSKYPLTAKATYLAAPERVRIVHLVRDGRAVTLSLMRRQGLTLEQAARRWTRFNWNLRLVLSTVGPERRFFVRYEDLCADPDATLRRLTEFVGADPAFRPLLLEKESFHNIGGNPMRFRRTEVHIKLDERWRRDLSPDQLRVFDRFGGRTNRRLGYRDP